MEGSEAFEGSEGSRSVPEGPKGRRVQSVPESLFTFWSSCDSFCRFCPFLQPLPFFGSFLFGSSDFFAHSPTTSRYVDWVFLGNCGDFGVILGIIVMTALYPELLSSTQFYISGYFWVFLGVIVMTALYPVLPSVTQCYSVLPSSTQTTAPPKKKTTSNLFCPIILYTFVSNKLL